MMYNIYDSKILTPSKCGSRYLDEVFNITQYGTSKVPTTLSEDANINELKTPSKIKEQIWPKEWREWNLDGWENGIQWIIIRPPEEITISAINTELLLSWNSGSATPSEEKVLVDSIISGKQGHYDPTLFKQLYFFWSFCTKKGNGVKFIHLKDLTKFVDEHLNFKTDLSKKVELHDFSNFPIFMSKTDMMDYFKRVYRSEWLTIETNMKSETFFWELILKNCKFYTPPSIL